MYSKDMAHMKIEYDVYYSNKRENQKEKYKHLYNFSVIFPTQK